MEESHQHFYAHGKLLLTGEYFVLDGALALALPCKFGQHLTLSHAKASNLFQWKSLDKEQQPWFEAAFQLPDFTITETNDQRVAQQLKRILRSIQQKKSPNDIQQLFSAHACTTELEFPRAWGLGTSSTLIVNLANWAEVDPFLLLAESFGGSGYDIACGMAEGPILYQKHQHLPKAWLRGGDPRIDGQFIHYPFHPPFADQLFFVYLGKKQNSRSGIQRYRQTINLRSQLIEEINQLTVAITQAQSLDDFEQLLLLHETLIQKNLQLKRAQDLYFSDYWGTVKSLGAWGGDFVLATSNRSTVETIQYFKNKNFGTILSYQDMIL